MSAIPYDLPSPTASTVSLDSSTSSLGSPPERVSSDDDEDLKSILVFFDRFTTGTTPLKSPEDLKNYTKITFIDGTQVYLTDEKKKEIAKFSPLFEEANRVDLVVRTSSDLFALMLNNAKDQKYYLNESIGTLTKYLEAAIHLRIEGVQKRLVEQLKHNIEEVFSDEETNASEVFQEIADAYLVAVSGGVSLLQEKLERFFTLFLRERLYTSDQKQIHPDFNWMIAEYQRIQIATLDLSKIVLRTKMISAIGTLHLTTLNLSFSSVRDKDLYHIGKIKSLTELTLVECLMLFGPGFVHLRNIPLTKLNLKLCENVETHYFTHLKDLPIVEFHFRYYTTEIQLFKQLKKLFITVCDQQIFYQILNLPIEELTMTFPETLTSMSLSSLRMMLELKKLNGLDWPKIVEKGNWEIIRKEDLNFKQALDRLYCSIAPEKSAAWFGGYCVIS